MYVYTAHRYACIYTHFLKSNKYKNMHFIDRPPDSGKSCVRISSVWDLLSVPDCFKASSPHNGYHYLQYSRRLET